jgi:hypothetical protein
MSLCVCLCVCVLSHASGTRTHAHAFVKALIDLIGLNESRYQWAIDEHFKQKQMVCDPMNATCMPAPVRVCTQHTLA